MWYTSRIWRSIHDYAVSGTVRAVAAAQAGLAITLASLAPLTLLWYFSVAGRDTYGPSILANGFLFGV